MAATPEKKVKQKVVAELKKFGAYYFYPVTSGFGSSGVFDIVVCYKGRFIGIECKADMEKRGPTALQSRNARQAKAYGAIVMVVDNSNIDVVSETLSYLEECDDSGEEFERFSFWPFDGVTD